MLSTLFKTARRMVLPRLLPILIFLFQLAPAVTLLAAMEEKTVTADQLSLNAGIKKQTEHQFHAFTNSLGMKFVNLPPGSYMMGSSPNQPGSSVFEEQKQVVVSTAFFMQTTEVTQAQWKRIMGDNPSYFNDCGADCPVEQVSWYDVQKFIQRLNQKDSMNRYRLPTEIEWEYACRAGSDTLFANVDTLEFNCNEETALKEFGWYRCNSNGTTHQVSQKMPNAWGLYDMHGNVYEWSKNPFAKPHLNNEELNQEYIDTGADRTCRSCSWDDSAISCRSASRINIKPEIRSNMIGFRLVREHAMVYKIKKSGPSESHNLSPAEISTAKEPTAAKKNKTEEGQENYLFTVQVAATKDLISGQRLVDRLTRMGHAAFMEEVVIPEKGRWYRIRVGRFFTRSDAVEMRQRLLQHNFEGIVISE